MNSPIYPDSQKSQDTSPEPFNIETCFDERRKSLGLSTHRSLNGNPDLSLPFSLFKIFPSKSPEETEFASQINLETQGLKFERQETDSPTKTSPTTIASRMKRKKEYNLSMDLNNSFNTDGNKELTDSVSGKEKKSVRFGSVPISEVGSFMRDSPVHQSGIKRVQSLGLSSRNKDAASSSEKSETKSLRKSSFGAAILLKKLSINTQKPPNVSITFDAFVDKQKGEKFEMNASFPSYKKDKRMEFMGRRYVYPEFIVPEKSKFRKNWNIFIILLILYELIWYPMAATFLFDWEVPKRLQTLDWLLIMTFTVDIIINLRTTYCNKESEEIVDDFMVRDHYLKSSNFVLDLLCVLPVGEVLYSFNIKSAHRHYVYSIPKLIRLIRIFKISRYLKNINLFLVFKILKTIIPFFLLVHWISCLWFLMAKLQYDEHGTTQTVWFPNSLRMITPDPSMLWEYYTDMSYVDKYGFTMLSVFMLMIGSDMAPTNQLQIYITAIIGMLGVLSFAYVAALVTYIISKRGQKDSDYQQKREELQNKLKVNNIPLNLREKVMEYFTYTWKKNKIFQNLSDFSELSLPLQRDLAFYLNKNLITNVPLFYDLEPIEILSIIQKLKTSIYMPGDKIIRKGERGNEMFFIQEGVVEIVIKIANPDPKSLNTSGFHKIYLEREDYFGEIALFSNSKRTTDVNAYEFCVLETFSRADYNNLKKDFPDIIPRLKAGLNYYKIHRASKIMAILKQSPFFDDFLDFEICTIVETYMEEIFMEPDKIILRPKNKTNSLYFVFLGNVNSYADNVETKEYLNNLLGEKQEGEEEIFECLDDELVGEPGARLSINQTKKKKLEVVKTFSYGDSFGSVDLDENDTICEHYFLSDTGCQLGAITNSLMEDLSLDIPYLYHKFRRNILKHTPKKRMAFIQEETESFTVGSHRRFSKQGKSGVTARFGSKGGVPTNVILEDGVAGFKEQLDKLQNDVDTFKDCFSTIDKKLSQLVDRRRNRREKTRKRAPVKTQQENKPLKACIKKQNEEVKNQDESASLHKRSKSVN